MAERGAFRLADIYRLRLVQQPAVSPDGRWVAFVMYGSRREENERENAIWIVASDGSAPARRLTRSFAGDEAPRWSAHGRCLAFLSTRPDELEVRSGGKEEEPRQQVWVLDLAGGEPRQLTRQSEGVEAFDWSPDGTAIVFAGRDPNPAQERYLTSIRGKLDGAGGEKGPLVFTRIQHKYDGRGYFDDVRTHLFTVDVESREVRRLTDGPCDERDPRWSPDGQWIIFVSNRTGDADNNMRTDLWLTRPDGSEARRLTFGDVDATEPSWSPDGRAVAFVASRTPDEQDWAQEELFWIATESAELVANLAASVGEGWSTVGGLVPAVVDGDPVEAARTFPVPLRATPMRLLTEGLDRSIYGRAVWLSETELLAKVADRGQLRLARVSVEGKVTRVLPVADRLSSLVDLDVAGGTIALTVNRPEEGIDLAVLAVEDLARADVEERPRRLTEVNQDVFAGLNPVRYERVGFANSEGQEIEGVAVLPAGFDPAAGPAPLVLLPHGGPVMFDEPALHFYPAWFMGEAFLAHQGNLVLMVNYRGSDSYGAVHADSIRRDWGPREYDDIMAGVQAMIDRGWADPERLFVTGVSYGGFLTAWVTGSTDRFRAAVAELPAWDMTISYGASDLHSFFQMELGLPWHNPEGYRRNSPSHLVMNTKTPTLIMAGEVDWRCPSVTSEAYYLALKKIGVPTELVIYQGEHHASTRPRQTVDRMIRICRWFERYGGLPFVDDSAEGYPSGVTE